MAIFKNLVNSITGKPDTPEETPAPAESAASAPSPEPAPKPVPRPPRLVVEAPLIRDGGPSDDDPNAVRIKAQPSADNSECKLMLDRQLLEGGSWYFSSRGATRGSALAEAIFAADADIESVLVHGSTLTITRLDKGASDWKPLAVTVGAALRSFVQTGAEPMSDEIRGMMLSDDELRTRVQKVIDEEINPGVAGHGGVINIVQIENNAVTINMGGGCQGCSSAALTLKGGIERAFRTAVPELGALLDATDHAAGTNPYFS